MSPAAMSSMMRPLATPPRFEPAERLREVDADEAERAHLLDQLGLDAGLRLALPIAGGEPLLREAARHVAHRELFVAESEVHVIAPG